MLNSNQSGSIPSLSPSSVASPTSPPCATDPERKRERVVSVPSLPFPSFRLRPMLSFEVAAMPVWFPAAAICAAQPPTVATADLQKATASGDQSLARIGALVNSNKFWPLIMVSNKVNLQNQLRNPALVTLKNLMRSLTVRLEDDIVASL